MSKKVRTKADIQREIEKLLKESENLDKQTIDSFSKYLFTKDFVNTISGLKSSELREFAKQIQENASKMIYMIQKEKASADCVQAPTQTTTQGPVSVPGGSSNGGIYANN